MIVTENSSVFTNGGTKVLREEIANPGNGFFVVGRRGLRGPGPDCPGRVWIGSQAVNKDDAISARQQILDQMADPAHTPSHRCEHEHEN